MNIRLANKKDIDALISMYMDIIQDMRANDICIWDDIYPIEQIEIDVLDGVFYVLEKDNTIVAGFSVYDDNSAKGEIEWHDIDATALYLGCIGVNMDYRRQGIGREIIDKSVDIAIDRGIHYIRLLVENRNVPAINMYTKYGFEKKRGIHKESYPSRGLELVECGYEKRVQL